MKIKQDEREIRWGIIGCGDVTEVKSGPAYQNTDGFELIAVMRRNVEKARDYARRHGVPKVHASADALIADPEVDAVYIATPPDSHHTYALKVAAAGKPCCIEKPMAPTYEECMEILAAFEKNNIPLFVAYYRRTLPRFTKIKEWLDQRLIGEVRHVEWRLSKPPSDEDLSGAYNWRTDAAVARAGYFDDLASHGLDLFSFYFGNFKKVSGITAQQQGLYSAFDAIAACWLHESGITGCGSWNFGCADSADCVRISGSTGRIEFSIFDEAPVRLITAASECKELTIEHPAHVQQPHVEAMRDSLLRGTTHPSPGCAGAHTAWVMEAIMNG